jgi:hypothetical protein
MIPVLFRFHYDFACREGPPRKGVGDRPGWMEWLTRVGPAPQARGEGPALLAQGTFKPPAVRRPGPTENLHG